jgi:hypothetical protein
MTRFIFGKDKTAAEAFAKQRNAAIVRVPTMYDKYRDRTKP